VELVRNGGRYAELYERQFLWAQRDVMDRELVAAGG
jgi:hypothetical protein